MKNGEKTIVPNWFTVRIRTNTEENISVNEAIEQIQKPCDEFFKSPSKYELAPWIAVRKIKNFPGEGRVVNRKLIQLDIKDFEKNVENVVAKKQIVFPGEQK